MKPSPLRTESPLYWALVAWKQSAPRLGRAAPCHMAGCWAHSAAQAQCDRRGLQTRVRISETLSPAWQPWLMTQSSPMTRPMTRPMSQARPVARLDTRLVTRLSANASSCQRDQAWHNNAAPPVLTQRASHHHHASRTSRPTVGVGWTPRALISVEPSVRMLSSIPGATIVIRAFRVSCRAVLPQHHDGWAETDPRVIHGLWGGHAVPPETVRALRSVADPSREDRADTVHSIRWTRAE
jgi:hypothetical protein